MKRISNQHNSLRYTIRLTNRVAKHIAEKHDALRTKFRKTTLFRKRLAETLFFAKRFSKQHNPLRDVILAKQNTLRNAWSKNTMTFETHFKKHKI